MHGLHRHWPNHTIKEVFQKFGEVTKVTNTGKGYGFVEFATEAQARKVNNVS